MRAKVLIVVTVALIASLNVRGQDAAPAAAVSSGATDSDEAAVWTPRTLSKFRMPLVANSENGPLVSASCDQISDTLQVLLLKLGARPSDIKVDLRTCYGSSDRSADATFFVLAPPTNDKAAEGPIRAGWETVMMKGDCRFLEMATIKVLPLFTTRNVKRISGDVCARLGVGIFAQVLKSRGGRTAPP
jgi:hypothetical protein